MKSKNWFIYICFISVGSILPFLAEAQVTFKPQVLEKTKKAIVTIHGQATIQAYDLGATGWSGTGFIINKEKGYILTNAHVAGGAVIGEYYLYFHDGTRADAKLLYDDPWLDYAFLEVDPQLIPQAATVIKFSNQNPRIDEPVFIIGNNEGKGFSIHTGSITGLYEIEEVMPQQAIRLSLNTVGGSSGSPIMNQQGEAVALNYGGGDNYGLGVHPAYIRYAIKAIEKGQRPVRKHIGIIVGMYSLNEAVSYRNFPTNVARHYAERFPNALAHAIQVQRILPQSPADGKLLPGDIIWAVDGKEIGPNLVDLDMAFNTTQRAQVVLTIYRNGQQQTIPILLYNLEDHRIKQLVTFGGAVFFESDDCWSDKLGIPAKTLCLAAATLSGTFDGLIPYIETEQGRLFGLQIMSINNQPILNLKQLIEVIPACIQEEDFTLQYINYIPANIYDHWYVFGPRVYIADVRYDQHAPEPKIFTFDAAKLTWERQAILP